MRTMVRQSPRRRLVVVELLIIALQLGLGGFNGSLVVNMKNMGAFSYNETDQTVTFGPVRRLLTSNRLEDPSLFLQLT